MPAGTTVQDNVWRRLDALQQDQDGAQRYLVFLPVACGLGGQATGRVQTLMMALALGRKAVFLSLEDRPYGQTFEAMHAPVDLGDGTRSSLEVAQAAPLASLDVAQDDAIVTYDPMRMPLEEVYRSGRLLPLVSAQVGVEITDRHLLEGLVFNWMRPTPAMLAYCEAQRDRLGVSADTLGIHFRRGDKAVETAFVPAAEFNRAIARIHQSWPFSTLFLASDSPHAPEEIVCPPGVTLIFDTEEQRYNNANHKMLMKSPELVDQETQVAFKNIYLLAQCGGVVGQDNAHFATLSAASVLARDGRAERVTLIDGRAAEKGSPALALFFRAKKGARALARRLFPQLTMSARMKRQGA